MSTPQIIRTPSGEELVVLPRAEYEALLKRADQLAEFQRYLEQKDGIGSKASWDWEPLP